MPPSTGSSPVRDAIGAASRNACGRGCPRDRTKLSVVVLAKRLGQMPLHSARHEDVLTAGASGRADAPRGSRALRQLSLEQPLRIAGEDLAAIGLGDLKALD